MLNINALIISLYAISVIPIVIIGFKGLKNLYLIVIKPKQTNLEKRKAAFILSVVIVFLLCMMLVNSRFFNRNLEGVFGDDIRRELIMYNQDGKIMFEMSGRFDFTYDFGCIEYVNYETGLKHNIFPGSNVTVVINELK